MSCKHLVKRKNSSVYHYRIIAPTDLKSVLIQQSLEISLSTGIHRIAQSRARKLNQFIQNLFQAYREGHMASLTMTIVKEFAKQELAKMYRHAEFTYTNTNVFDPSAVSSAIESVNNQEMRFENNLKTNHKKTISKIDNNILNLLRKYFDVENVNVSSKEFLMLRSTILEIKKRSFSHRRELLNGTKESSWSLLNEIESDVSQSGLIEKTTNNEILQNLISEPEEENSKANAKTILHKFLKEKSSEIEQKTAIYYESVVDLMTEILGNKPMSSITKKDAVRCKEIFQQLPPNRNKSSRFRNKSIEEILRMRNFQPLSTTTINHYLTSLCSLFNWAQKHDYVSANVFSGLTIKQKTKARDQRDAFDEQDLKRIFNLRKLKSESIDKNKPAYYWVPLLGQYTGARLNELCQLYVNDIKEIDKIWCIDINRNTNDKKLKNASSERVIPIHPKLIELGFLNFVKEQKKKKTERLFSHLKLGSDGYIKNVSRFFNVKWLPEIGVKTSKKSFHSLRHTFANELKQVGVNEQVASELLGHASQSITYGRYGKESRIEVLLEQISKIFF